ncbi:type II toxin-antitoxin system PemK/MazF family toxin [uncultured Eubacterium sp.]|uniref:type II toxin-antitoxin system PemK/MazF family toxin n=1 Tax=uncultured Eubacterium sp. TaxID=165185 RepID=UPI002592D8FE|nr:type II toxin-antitoxin system PemK/MazF family toxin [uncultured Eubacterium sp.]
MSNYKSKEKVIKHKDNTIEILDNYLTELAETQPKKADLISYWLHTYTNYLKYEEIFDPKKNKRYERGDIVKVQFGFNVGSEYGGLHYAVVIDKDNNLSSPVVTVVPLSSTDNKKISNYNVDLGNELVQKVKAKLLGMQQKLLEEEKTIESILKELSIIINDSEINDEKKEIYVPIEKLEVVRSAVEKGYEKQRQIDEKKKDIKKMLKELSKMKTGSMALVNQITCISKIRIEDPKDMHGVLHGIKLSPKGLDNINDKLKEMYIWNA